MVNALKYVKVKLKKGNTTLLNYLYHGINEHVFVGDNILRDFFIRKILMI